MKTVIIYASVHHNNTKELVCAIAAENDIDVVDATKITEKDLSGYDLIGFASGIYFGKLHQSVINFAEVNLPENKDVFLICTYGGKPVFDSIKKIVKEKQKNREKVLQKSKFCCILWVSHIFFTTQAYGCLLYTSDAADEL